ncbi:1-phosphofructokinase family hexose kinase [Micromonospora sp. C28SCA-DRY-2]|uniref:1-phosphofructokinase family hexose kinase n=1 Tax=Micromonospora sp. C28SCA-DRY-2 TaxID=3059522 RepID=UPI0026774326|nr:1-phosphofructokinase family hexose kinase [Micromonospora sp. C28SCA-DRY-2]MDO3705130.1 1-phosphofructokinase family hexose kinase [Micromonospora sp. C28SCA-DRY-2]
MIVTVTLNPALDITHTVASLVPHRSHRVSDVAAQAGGKGVNVARVLHTLGLPTVAVAFRGGLTGAAVAADLDRHGIAHRLVDTAGESRRTFTVVDRGSGDATVFNEAGPAVSDAEWRALRGQVRRLLAGASVLVLSGSLPPGLPDTAYAELAGAAARAGVPVILDAAGPPLRAGLAAGPDVIKPNATELAEATGLPDPLAAAEALRAAGARAVVASLGPAGLLAVTPDGTFRAEPPAPLAGNPTGAGDSVVAAIAAGIHTGTPWPHRLAEAVALSAATVRAPRAGQFDADTYHRLAPRPAGTRTPTPHTT